MKKIIPAAAILLVVIALASCGSSRKYGCPATAKHSATNPVKA